MNERCLRQKPRISYYEPEEPNLDDYVYCDKCADLVYEYCSIHGPLLVVPDDKVPAKPNVPSFVPRAALTIPNVFLHLSPSSIPDAGLGVFATLTLPSGVRFGPYTGERTDGVDSYYCWQIYDVNRKPSYCIDATDADRSNWMRYVNCARHWSEQNLVAFQYQGQLYYRTTKIIPRFTELLVFYGSEFANELDIDLGKYNSPRYAKAYGSSYNKKHKQDVDPKTNNEDAINRSNAAKGFENVTKHQHHNLKNIKESHTDKNNCNKNDVTMPVNDVDVTLSNDKHLEPKTIQASEMTFNKISNPIDNRNEDRVDSTKASVDNYKTNDFYHSCDKCNKKYIIKSDLEKHIRFHDLKRGYACEVCSYRFVGLTDLNKHKFFIHRIKCTNIIEHECERCDKIFYNISNLKDHMRTHTGEKPFTCATCNAKLSSRNTLKGHMRTHTGEKPFTCATCNAKLSSRNTLKVHMRTHTGERPFTCATCNAKFSSKTYLKRHIRTHTGERPYTCATCNAKFTAKNTLKGHMRIHTGEKPFTCATCNAKFTARNTLKSHMRTHTGEKPFTCATCNAKFTARNTLKSHMRTHTGERPFACATCNAKFSSKTSLKRHIRTHTGERPFTCATCNAKFTAKNTLKGHMRIHTGEKPFTCATCNAKFTARNTLKSQKRTHTGEKPFTCATCNATKLETSFENSQI